MGSVTDNLAYDPCSCLTDEWKPLKLLSIIDFGTRIGSKCNSMYHKMEYIHISVMFLMIFIFCWWTDEKVVQFQRGKNSFVSSI
jgi:hypothetical protein